MLPFNNKALGIAHELYKELLAPAADLIAGKDLLIVPSGPLTALPFQLLVTEPPDLSIEKMPDAHRKAAWLARRHAIAVLPSVVSLIALRRPKRTEPAPEQFWGMGNPLLTASEGTDLSAWDTQNCANLKSASEVQTASVKLKGVEISSVFHGPLADVEKLRRLKPLPQSAYELCDIAQRLGIDHPDQVVYLGSRATETAVKAMSEDGTLGRYQIVYFSTHGLLAGEIDAEGEQHRSGQLHEAGLVLTPPEKAGEEDDGLLTASEIAQLRLNAEWVVLSACNTAAGDRPGTQALSGLAKAYFYAGARTLLVSHWGVYASAASELGTKTFAELHANKGISKAEALRRSMAELFNSKRPSDIAIARGDTDRAHPTYWAPFILVGDGR